MGKLQLAVDLGLSNKFFDINPWIEKHENGVHLRLFQSPTTLLRLLRHWPSEKRGNGSRAQYNCGNTGSRPRGCRSYPRAFGAMNELELLWLKWSTTQRVRATVAGIGMFMEWRLRRVQHAEPVQGDVCFFGEKRTCVVSFRIKNL